MKFFTLALVLIGVSSYVPQEAWDAARVGPSAYDMDGGYEWMAWERPWIFLLFALLLVVTSQVQKRIHWSVGPAFLVTLSSALALVCTHALHPPNQVLDAAGLVLNYQMLGLMSGSTAFCFLIPTLFLLLASRDQLEAVRDGMAWLCLLNALAMIWQATHYGPTRFRGGFFGNPGAAGCFTAMTYFELVGRKNRLIKPGFKLVEYGWMALVFLAPLTAVYLADASMPILTFLTALLAKSAAIWWRSKLRRRMFAETAVASILILGLGAIFQGSKLWDSSGRIQFLSKAVRYWWEHGDRLNGYGLGTAKGILPYVQQRIHFWDGGGSWFTFAHSEPVRALIELGPLGLAAYALALGFALRAAWRQPTVFAGLSGWIMCGLGDFPTSLALSALYGMTLVRVAHDQPRSGAKLWSNEAGAINEMSR